MKLHAFVDGENLAERAYGAIRDSDVANMTGLHYIDPVALKLVWEIGFDAAVLTSRGVYKSEPEGKDTP